MQKAFEHAFGAALGILLAVWIAGTLTVFVWILLRQFILMP